VSLQAYLRPEARADLAAAATWYEERRTGLGSEFLDEFLAAIEQIETSPNAFPLVDVDVRRALLRRFPYALFYSVEPTQVEVLAVMDCRRHPATWRRRL
jgi:toxin ParE1/3/4